MPRCLHCSLWLSSGRALEHHLSRRKSCQKHWTAGLHLRSQRAFVPQQHDDDIPEDIKMLEDPAEEPDNSLSMAEPTQDQPSDDNWDKVCANAMDINMEVEGETIYLV
jgi:hypothetical protein